VEPTVTWKVDAALRAAIDPAYDGANKDGVSDNMFLLRGHAAGELQYKPRSSLRIKLGGELLYRLIMNRVPEDGSYFGHLSRHEIEPRLRESFVEYSGSWLDIKAGMVTTVWGKNALMNPNDVLSAFDLRDGPALDPQQMRFPVPTLRVDAFIKGLSISAIWMPGFMPNQSDLFGTDFAFLGPGAPGNLGKLGTLLERRVEDSLESQIQKTLLQTEMPGLISGSIAAGRLGLSVHGWDLALQYCYTLTRTPVYRLRADFFNAIAPVLQKPYGPLSAAEWATVEQLLALSDPRPIRATYQRFHQVGLSVATTLWKLVAMFDLSYSDRRPLVLGGQTPVKPDGPLLSTSVFTKFLASTLGLQYTYGETIQLTMESWYELQIDVAQQDAAARPELMLGGPHRFGLALTGSWTVLSGDLKLELTGYSEFIDPGFVLMPRLSYRVGDHLQLFMGVNLFGGHQGSIGQLFHPNDQIYAGLRAYL
jgi:hypothetical protein